MRIPHDSLRLRLMLSAAIWILIGLLVAGLVIVELFRAHVTDQFREDLDVHLTELTATAIVRRDGRPALRHPLSDPRFVDPGSGYYWQVERDGQPVLRSPSLEGGMLLGPPARAHEPIWEETAGPNGRAMVHGRTVLVADGGPPLRLSIAADTVKLEEVIHSFRYVLTAALLLLGAILLGGGALHLVYGLRPLNRLGRTIAAMRKGGGKLEEAGFPSEIRPLIRDLAALLDANAAIVQRARVQAGNLAHGLRTPLAIIIDESERLARDGKSASARTLVEQCQKMQRHIDYHMARSRAAAAIPTPGLTTSLEAAMGPILNAMRRLHGPRGIRFRQCVAPDIALACDPQDFAEIISSLLDNAGKWACTEVTVSWHAEGDKALIAIEDDGPGLDPALRERVFAIGERLDDSMSGSGLGLAIARDLALLYGGRVWLEDRDQTIPGDPPGLMAMTELPRADI